MIHLATCSVCVQKLDNIQWSSGPQTTATITVLPIWPGIVLFHESASVVFIGTWALEGRREEQVSCMCSLIKKASALMHATKSLFKGTIFCIFPLYKKSQAYGIIMSICYSVFLSSLNNYSIHVWIFMKLGMDIMLLETTPLLYFLIFHHQ